MPLKIIDGDTFAELIFTCPADRDSRRVDAPHTSMRRLSRKVISYSDAEIVQKNTHKKIPENESSQVCMCVNEDVTSAGASSVNMRYDVEVSTCSETEEI